MVKILDDKNDGLLFEHLGIRLWRANEAWHLAFVEAMNAAGHSWFTRSRANLMGRIPRGGCRQADLIEKTGLTKQAVQQLLDGLEDHKIVERVVDPDDKRGRKVQYSDKGLAAMADADRIKREIEQRYRDKMGEKAFDELQDLLSRVLDD